MASTIRQRNALHAWGSPRLHAGRAWRAKCAMLVIVDDNFKSIVTGIRVGRCVVDNLTKATHHILAVHVPVLAADLDA